MSSVGHNHRLEMAAEGGGSGALILAEVGLLNKSIFVSADKRLQLERLLGCRAGLRVRVVEGVVVVGGGSGWLQMLQHREQKLGVR